MRISELSRRSAVPTATIKFYLREGLLPPGRPTAATQAEYDETHIRRLRLIRALVGVRGLSVSAAKEVLDAVSSVKTDTHGLLGLVFGIWPASAARESGGPRVVGEPARPTGEADGTDDTSDTYAVDALVSAMGWQITEHSPARQAITQTLHTLRSLGVEYGWEDLLPYAELAARTAVLDLDQLEGQDDPLDKAERAVLLTFLLEPALLALRRLAQEAESAARHTD
ncbi:MerR family transcriptional regulator [Streptomyces albipurpureus]|uniref:MerR family transcriptional regulator n=1 Tax=Streptomyces albipurpureus TaxID=2897419 RepID=A0ABT0UKG8_9ACTN|nr:MerR family transcriptional regulator [Streptomyces sp. CWNU-1]MCM2388716.1 MerR family transcriptional regulator [Streptomyces sp. CWNU-1]